jgi:hypothetical protein
MHLQHHQRLDIFLPYAQPHRDAVRHIPNALLRSLLARRDALGPTFMSITCIHSYLFRLYGDRMSEMLQADYNSWQQASHARTFCNRDHVSNRVSAGLPITAWISYPKSLRFEDTCAMVGVSRSDTFNDSTRPNGCDHS